MKRNKFTEHLITVQAQQALSDCVMPCRMMVIAEPVEEFLFRNLNNSSILNVVILMVLPISTEHYQKLRPFNPEPGMYWNLRNDDYSRIPAEENYEDADEVDEPDLDVTIELPKFYKVVDDTNRHKDEDPSVARKILNYRGKAVGEMYCDSSMQSCRFGYTLYEKDFGADGMDTMDEATTALIEDHQEHIAERKRK